MDSIQKIYDNIKRYKKIQQIKQMKGGNDKNKHENKYKLHIKHIEIVTDEITSYQINDKNFYFNFYEETPKWNVIAGKILFLYRKFGKKTPPTKAIESIKYNLVGEKKQHTVEIKDIETVFNLSKSPLLDKFTITFQKMEKKENDDKKKENVYSENLHVKEIQIITDDDVIHGKRKNNAKNGFKFGFNTEDTNNSLAKIIIKLIQNLKKDDKNKYVPFLIKNILKIEMMTKKTTTTIDNTNLNKQLIIDDYEKIIVYVKRERNNMSESDSTNNYKPTQNDEDEFEDDE